MKGILSTLANDPKMFEQNYVQMRDLYLNLSYEMKHPYLQLLFAFLGL